MKFTTTSGSKYTIYEKDGKQYIHRESDIPIVNLFTGGDMQPVEDEQVWFDKPPTIGERFEYATIEHLGCMSMPVVSIEE